MFRPLFADIHTNNSLEAPKAVHSEAKKTKLFILSVIRFYFYRMILPDEQMKVLIGGLQQHHLEGRDELIEYLLKIF